MIWRTVWRTSPVLCVPLFLYFGARKLLGWRPRATFGAARVESLPTVLPDLVPDNVLTEISPYLRACAGAGFSLAFYLKGNYIGSRRGYSAVFLNRSGSVCATVVWLRLWGGSFTKTSVVFACHTCLADGVELSTGPLDDKHWNPELVPPDQQLMRLPIGTPPEEVIDLHSQRIDSLGNVVRFDQESLANHVVTKAQKLFDFMVAKGIYVPITDREVQRLSATPRR
jgi:hypothetical protein